MSVFKKRGGVFKKRTGRDDGKGRGEPLEDVVRIFYYQRHDQAPHPDLHHVRGCTFKILSRPGVKRSMGFVQFGQTDRSRLKLNKVVKVISV